MIFETEVNFLRARVIILLVIFSGLPASAAEKIVLTDMLNVYPTAKAATSPKWKLKRGQSVTVSSSAKNGFRRVRGVVKGKTVAGYALDSDLEEYLGAPRKAPGGMIGVSYIFSQVSQKNRELETNDDTTYEISRFSGTSQFFRVFADRQLTPSLIGRASIVKRETQSAGNATVKGSGTFSDIILTQSFLGAQAELAYANRDFWIGGGFEVSKGMAVEIETKSGPVIEDSGLEMPFFTILSIGAGAYLGPVGPIYIMPEFRAGMVVTTDPMTQLYEVLLNVGYKL